jgi:hypothetical protein
VTTARREPREVGVVDPAHLEHTVGADVDAVALALAAGAIDDGVVGAGRRAALLAGARRVSGGAAGLLLVEALGDHEAPCMTDLAAAVRSAREEVCGPFGPSTRHP